MAFIFIPGSRFESLLPPRERRYRGPELTSPDVQEKNRVATAPIIAQIAPTECDRHYDGELKSPNGQEKTRVASAHINAQLTPNENHRHFDGPGLDLNLQEIKRVAHFPDPLPSFEEPPRTFRHGATVVIDSNARDITPKLSIEYKLEPPNNIHLLVKIRSYGYLVSALEFKINFCNGKDAIMIDEYRPTENDSDHKEREIKVRENTVVDGKVTSPLDLLPVSGGGHREISREYIDIKESYIQIEGLREDDHSISWVCYTVGESAKPLKTIELMVSIRIPKETNITKLTASFEARPKCFKLERNSLVGNIGRIFAGEVAKLHSGEFPVHFRDY